MVFFSCFFHNLEHVFVLFFQFYKETLDTSNDETAHENVEVPDIKIGAHLLRNSRIAQKLIRISNKRSVFPTAPEELKTLEDISNVKPKIEPSPPKTAQGLKSALSIFRGKNRPKKSVKWKRDDELEAVQFFEVDASERSKSLCHNSPFLCFRVKRSFKSCFR